MMLKQALLIILLTMSILACHREDTSAPVSNFVAGSTLNVASNTCELNLTDGVSVNAEG
jgi:hypothetical protein